MSQHLKKLQAGLNPSERLNQIVEHGMCIGCGLCESLATQNEIHLKLAHNGSERPISNQHSPPSHELLDQIIDTCPGTRLENIPSSLLGNSSKYDEVWGDYQSLIYAHAAEPDVRHMASTGGFLSAMALYLLESKSVDFIVHAKASTTNPSFGQATISRTRDDVLTASGSRYGPTATLKDIINVLTSAEQNSETFAFIGTPCDVSALRNLANIDQRVNERCSIMLTMVCGGFMAPAAMSEFIQNLGVNEDDIASIRYRGYGCPGPTTIKLKDDTKVERSYLDFWGEDDSAWQLPSRCKVCADGIGDAADIAAADCWEGGAPTIESSASDLGRNAVIVRSEYGQTLMDQAVAAGYLTLGKSITPADLNRFQPHQVAKKQAIWARFKGMQEANHLTPITNNLRLKRLYQQNESAKNTAEQIGTKQRVEAGKFTEMTPD